MLKALDFDPLDLGSSKGGTLSDGTEIFPIRHPLHGLQSCVINRPGQRGRIVWNLDTLEPHERRTVHAIDDHWRGRV